MANPKNIFFKIVLFLVLFCGVFGAGFFIGQKQSLHNVAASNSTDFSLFWDAYNKLHEHYVNPEKIDSQKLLYGAINGMVRSVGDPFTDFFSPEQAKMFQQDLAGSFEGIGAEIGIKKEQLIIIAPLKGTPAEKAGLKSGDYVVRIDEKSTAELSVDEAVNLIRGKKGTSVTLTIFREGWKDVKDIVITRDMIKVDSVTWELKEGNVAYIYIHQFDQTLSADFKKIAQEVVNSKAQKIILDLRQNPGGYLEVSQDIAGWFLKSGQVVTIEDFGHDKQQQIYKAQGNSLFANYPMVVLIDKGSASASEILAGALRDNRGIQLIGEKSFGKGSVQELVDLQDGKSFLKITIAKWLTPKGNSISEVGLTPDIKVSQVEGAAAEKDAQLEKALEIIKFMQ